MKCFLLEGKIIQQKVYSQYLDSNLTKLNSIFTSINTLLPTKSFRYCLQSLFKLSGLENLSHFKKCATILSRDAAMKNLGCFKALKRMIY